jgi:flagellar biogenesis protein FliO
VVAVAMAPWLGVLAVVVVPVWGLVRLFRKRGKAASGVA